MPNRSATVKKPYTQHSIKKRMEAFFLDNLGKIATREQLIDVSTDPRTGKFPENWHQGLSELRIDDGYTILSWRNRRHLKRSEYIMPNDEKRKTLSKRIRPPRKVWNIVLEENHHTCAWSEDGITCGLKEGEIDMIGGGTVQLTPDHITLHSVKSTADSGDPSKWRPLCGRHQIMKKNYWDEEAGWLNVVAIIQSASEKQKEEVFDFLKDYFNPI